MTTRDDRPSDRRLSAVWLAAGVLLLCGLGLAHATSAMIVAGDGQASTPPRTYRVLTYNVQFRPPALNDNSAYNMLSELRAEHTASAILAGGYDIVALNEVFHEGARDVLLNRLAPHYQVVFDMIRSGTGGPILDIEAFQDSGLMFFSKFPLADLSTPPGGRRVRGRHLRSAGLCLPPRFPRVFLRNRAVTGMQTRASPWCS